MDVLLSKQKAPLVVVLAIAIVAGGCSSGSSPSASAAPSVAASIDPTASYPSKSGSLPSVTFAQSVPQLSFAPFEIAQNMNFFGYEGVKLQFIQLQSGATSLQAMESGSIDLVDSASTEVATAAAKGLDFEAIENTIMMTLQFCVSKDWAQQHKVTASSTIQQKMAAMKGATIGITGPGAVSDTATRYLLKKYGNLNPDTDTRIIQVGGAAAIPGALDAGQIQGFLLSPPACGQTKNGMVLVDPSQLPEFQNYTHEVVYGSKKWLTANKDLATKVATAVAMGNNFILKYPAAALALLEKDFPKVAPSVVETSFNDTIKPQIKPDGKFDASMWQNTMQVFADMGIVKQALDTSEGGVWTNAYIGDASVR